MLLGICLFLISQIVLAQQVLVKGRVSDEKGLPIAGATVSVINAGTVATQDDGRFAIAVKKAGNYTITVTSIGYQSYISTIGTNAAVSIQLTTLQLFLQPIEVKAIRAGSRMPFTKTNLNKQEIEKMNTGQDLPFIINQTPSVVVNSDAGNGVGYTGIRIRGSDATRINMTINGIPYNDAESQGLFFVNLPDLASSVNSIQIQRGVGTSGNGAGAFGATLNLSTNDFNEKAYAELNNSIGSFNTFKHTIKAGTGLINKHYTLDARVSKITSDGFIDRAGTNLQSVFVSGARYGEKTTLRFNILSGKEKTYQAWNGIPEAKLTGNNTDLLNHYYNNLGVLYKTTADSVNLFTSNNRTYNTFLYNNQTDNYRQDHYQFFVNHKLPKSWTLATAFFLTRGRGYYQEQKIDESTGRYGYPYFVVAGDTVRRADIIRQLWLDNYFFGTVFSASHKTEKDELTFGGAITRYNGDHYGKVINATVNIPAGHIWYNLDAHKTDFNVYAKYQRQLNKEWQLFTDLQYRTVSYILNGFRNNPSIRWNNQYHFFNPKIGISYYKNGLEFYTSAGIGNKEPNREDFESGNTQKPAHETLYNIEMNIGKRYSNSSWSVTGFYMKYKNQLVVTGKINDVGAYTRTNIPNSYRAGIEAQGAVQPTNWFNASANFTISKNHLISFTEFLDDYDLGGQKAINHGNAPIALSPDYTGAATLNFIPLNNTTVSLLNKYVSRQYLDNTGNKARSINPFYVADARVAYNWQYKWLKNVTMALQVNNLFNKLYEANGYTYSYIYGGQTITENFFYPMAGRNVMATINIKL